MENNNGITDCQILFWLAAGDSLSGCQAAGGQVFVCTAEYEYIKCSYTYKTNKSCYYGFMFFFFLVSIRLMIAGSNGCGGSGG